MTPKGHFHINQINKSNKERIMAITTMYKVFTI